MNHINTVTYGGNLTRDPEIRYTPKGTAVCELSIANTEKWKTEFGEQKERTCFAGATIWGKSAEVFAQYHKKGQQCLVQGKLYQDTWEDKATGQKREKTKILVEEWFFVGGKRDDQKPPQAHAPRQNTPAKEPAQTEIPTTTTAAIEEFKADDDVPF